jgi:hypothetical protein
VHDESLTRVLLGALVLTASLLVCFSGPTANAATPAISPPTWVTLIPAQKVLDGGSDLTDISCIAADDCTAVGSLSEFAGLWSAIARHWNGTTWSQVKVPSGIGTVQALGNQLSGVSCTSASFCVAVGVVIDLWDGTTWSAGPAQPPQNSLNAVSCTSSTMCMAVGTQPSPSPGVQETLVQQWNGATWSVVPSPNQGVGLNNALTGISCTASDFCIAVGTASNGTVDQTLIEQWNGAAWSIVASPNSASDRNNDLHGVSCTSAAYCTAVGSASNGIVDQTLIERWNGVAWSIVASPNTSSTLANDLGGVSCVSSTSCQATGTAQDAGGIFEAWDGTSWSFAPAQDAEAVNGISCSSSTQCFAVGGGEAIDVLYTQGYREVASDGGIFDFGAAQYYGSMGGQHLNAPIVGMAATPDDKGYWEVAADGGLFSFGDAHFYGSTGSLELNQPIVGMAPTPDGKGYWLVAADGGIFAFGDAPYLGSKGGGHLNQPVVGIAATTDGQGYWEVASDGGIFGFGDAQFAGSMGGQHLNAPMVGMAATPHNGYWEVASDGGIFDFGGAFNGSFYGSTGNIHLNAPVVAMVATPDGNGYWEVASDGGIFSFGTAVFEGSQGGQPLNAPIVGAASAGSLG